MLATPGVGAIGMSVGTTVDEGIAEGTGVTDGVTVTGKGVTEGRGLSVALDCVEHPTRKNETRR